MHAQTHRHTHNAPVSGTLLLGTLPLPPAVHPSSEICLAIMLVNAARPCDPILFICVCVCVCVRACVCPNGHGMLRAWFEQSTAQVQMSTDTGTALTLLSTRPLPPLPFALTPPLTAAFRLHPPPACPPPPPRRGEGSINFGTLAVRLVFPFFVTGGGICDSRAAHMSVSTERIFVPKIWRAYAESIVTLGASSFTCVCVCARVRACVRACVRAACVCVSSYCMYAHHQQPVSRRFALIQCCNA